MMRKPHNTRFIDQRTLKVKRDKPVTIDGVDYPSQHAAARALGVSRSTLWARLNPERRALHRSRTYYKNPEKYREAGRVYSRKKLPAPTRPCPALCEAECGRDAKCLDHDHGTGRFRGWLCTPCNWAANKYHTPATLRSLADYLERS